MWCFEDVQEYQFNPLSSVSDDAFTSVAIQLTNARLIKSRIQNSVKKLELTAVNTKNLQSRENAEKEIQKLARCLQCVAQHEQKLKSFLYVEEALDDCKKRGFDPQYYIIKGGRILQQAIEEKDIFLSFPDPLQRLDEVYE